MISLALYLPLVISLDTYAFDCKNIKCRIGGSYLQEKSLPLLFLETFWSCHGESGKWKFERTVTLMGRWPKTNVYHIEQGIYWVDHLKRNCIGTIYNSRCEFILIESVMAECNMSCSEEKSDFADRECFPLKEEELNLNHRINLIVMEKHVNK